MDRRSFVGQDQALLWLATLENAQAKACLCCLGLCVMYIASRPHLTRQCELLSCHLANDIIDQDDAFARVLDERRSGVFLVCGLYGFVNTSNLSSEELTGDP